MNYIVFDLEWNQGTQENTVSQMPFEIIEIGAVKLNEQFEKVDTFHRLIYPQVYKELQDSIHRIVPLDMQELQRDGVSFRKAMKAFFSWCGQEEYRFCTWGCSDVTELQKNLRYFKIKIPFRTPVFYYDIQKCFGIQYPGDKGLFALEDAVRALELPIGDVFHRALEDAQYTAEILQFLDKEILKKNYSVDCYRNPQKRSEELHLKYPAHYQYISKEFKEREEMMRDKEVRATRCYKCRRNARRKIRWYAANNRSYYSQSWCQEHGYIVGKIHVRKTENGGVYADKLLKIVNKEEADKIRIRREEIRKKRREKKREKQEMQKKGIAGK